MALKFMNIRSGEIRVAETEPMIAALWSSSDRGPNVMQGQDFGWRLAPEVVIQMDRLKSDATKLQHIAALYNIPMEDVNERAILAYISDTTPVENAPVAQEGDYTSFYHKEISRLREEDAATATATTTTTTTTTKKK